MPPPRALRPAAVPDDGHPAGASVFGAAMAEVAAGIEASGTVRPEVSFDGEPPPRRLAPEAMAVAAAVDVGDDEIGSGRFVLLYDPAGQEGWVGPFRVIAYLRAELEPEIAADPLIGQVGWSWLLESLDTMQAGYAAPSGSVTRVVTEGFGTKADQPVTTEFEMRASWSPVSEGRDRYALDRHVAAWVDALCVACGLPSAGPGVTQLPSPQLRSSQPGSPRSRSSQPGSAPARLRPLDQAPTGPDREPGTPPREPAAPHREPAAPDREPGTPPREPAAPHREPAAPHQEPAAPHQEPATPHQEPATPSQGPTDLNQRPIQSSQGPTGPRHRP